MMATKRALAILLWLFMLAAVADSLAAGTGHCCRECGCKKVKKMTRLVTSCREIEIPLYERGCDQAYCPAKGFVCHTKYRCDRQYSICSNWCVQEQRCARESCEHVDHYVDENPCDCACEHHEEHHHKKHFDYHVSARPRHCVRCQVERGCVTNYGANPNGCFQDVCIKKPTGDTCRQVVADVHWVTYHVCSHCKHSWPAESHGAVHD